MRLTPHIFLALPWFDPAKVQNRAGGVVRKIENDQPRLAIDRVAELLPVGMKIMTVFIDEQGYVPCDAAGQFNSGFIGIVRGVNHDDFVAVAYDGCNRAEQAFGCTGTDRNFRIDVQNATLRAVGLLGNYPA